MDVTSFFDYPDPERAGASQDLLFLADLSDQDWDRLLAYTETRRFATGEVVMDLGEVERALYIITEGSLEVLIPEGRDQRLRRLAVREAGTVIGEVAFLDAQPRSAQLRAISDGELVRLSFEAFESLAVREPDIGRAILFDLGRILAVRLREATSAVSAWVR